MESERTDGVAGRVLGAWGAVREQLSARGCSPVRVGFPVLLALCMAAAGCSSAAPSTTGTTAPISVATAVSGGAAGASALADSPATAGAAAPPATVASAAPLATAVAAAPPATPVAAAAPSATPRAATPAAAPQVAAAPAVPPLTGSLLKDVASDFAAAERSDGVDVSAEGLRLGKTGSGFAGTAQYVSAVRETAAPFDNAVLSWNAETPAGTSLRFELRVRAGANWSGWFTMGEWGANGGRSVAGQSEPIGGVDVDTLVLKTPASAMQYRVTLSTTSTSNSPLVRQVAVTFANMSKGLTGPALPKGVASGRDLDVPKHSQLEEAASVRSEICSATSLAMVLQYWGVDRTVADVYKGVRDQTEGIYGNWPLNVAYAAANGMEGRVERFYGVEQLEREIAAGRPMIISISFKPGELDGSPITSTSGHLIVVRGFTSEGDVIVNDPIASNSQSVRLVYNREQLSRVWLRSGGIAYVVAPRGSGS